MFKQLYHLCKPCEFTYSADIFQFNFYESIFGESGKEMGDLTHDSVGGTRKGYEYTSKSEM